MTINTVEPCGHRRQVVPDETSGWGYSLLPCEVCGAPGHGGDLAYPPRVVATGYSDRCMELARQVVAKKQEGLKETISQWAKRLAKEVCRSHD